MRVLVVGGTGPTGPFIVNGLRERGFDVTIFHRATHEIPEIPDGVEHIHGDPHFRETIDAAICSRTFDLVVASYGRLRHLAETMVGKVGRFIAVGGFATYRGFIKSSDLYPAGLPVPVAEDFPVVAAEAADASPGKLKAAEITPPDAAAVVKLIRAAGAEESEFGIFLRMAATTGARRAELCALRWSDIDMAKGSLVIRRAMVEHPGGFLVKDTKTHASRRIAIDSVMVKALVSHRVRMTERGLAAGTPLDKQAYVFSYASDCADPWRPDVVTRRFVRLRDRLGLEDVRLHDLRRFVATRMLADGVAVPTVSGRLGHASSATTLNVYAHFLTASDRDAADSLGRVLDDAAGADQ